MMAAPAKTQPIVALTSVHRARLKPAVAAMIAGREMIFARERGESGLQMVWYDKRNVRNVILVAEGAAFDALFQAARIEFVGLLTTAMREQNGKLAGGAA